MENSIYKKRLQLLECKWNELMQEQNAMSIEEICSDAHQAKRQRIGNLYHRAMNAINEPKRMAIRAMLQSVKTNMSNVHFGKTTLKFQ
ncbi:hypothetical protein [Tenacibaculum sp.]|uniref:hypothetical protein n=1 Tax=Tenacibaculum sp. TaxID=1906242 RepID=UPI003D0C3DB7